MSPLPSREFDALVLAGGRGSRLGGVNKALLEVGGQRLVDRSIAAARASGATRVIVSGPDGTAAGADAVVREEPAYGGPLAGIAAGLSQLRASWVLILACDLQRPWDVASTLAQHLGSAARDGVVLVDQQGQVQWLAGIYRTAALVEACAGLGERVVNAPVRRVLGSLDLHRLPVSNQTSSDIDTPQALHDARRIEGKIMGTHLPPEALNDWLSAATERLSLDATEVDISTVLDVAKHVAHEVARPAAPLSTFLLGLALGSGKGDLASLSAQLIERAHEWSTEHPEGL